MGAQHRSSEIQRRRKRRRKLTLLRKRYTAAKTEGERVQVLAIAKRTSPMVAPEQFVARGQTRKAAG